MIVLMAAHGHVSIHRTDAFRFLRWTGLLELGVHGEAGPETKAYSLCPDSV